MRRTTSPWQPLLGELREALGTPLVVHLVANGVRGDSRVLKAAQTSVAAGYPSVVVGTTLAEQFEVFETEGVPVVLAPIGSKGTGVSGSEAPRLPEFAADWWRRTRGEQLRAAATKARSDRAQAKEFVALATWSIRHPHRNPSPPTWARLMAPAGPRTTAHTAVLEALRPAFVHVHDVFPLPAAVAYRASAPSRVAVLYDAHESVPTLAEVYRSRPAFRTMSRIETAFIRDADDVITVSEPIADLLQAHYGLRERPRVVANGPSAQRQPGPTVRDVIGLPADVPLAVYSGWIDHERGLGLVLRALSQLPELHLVIVTAAVSVAVENLVRLAMDLGVHRQVHFASYVTPAALTNYLSGADFGLIPRVAGPHLDLSLPTKFREYLHAGLPLVVSDNKEMARVVTETGVGESFPAGETGELIAAMRRVMSDLPRYRAAITAELLSETSWERQAEVLTAIYAERLGKVPAAPGSAPAVSRAIRDLQVATQTQEADDEAAAASTAPALAGSGEDAADESDGSSPREFVVFPPPINLGIGPSNMAGQAYRWASAVDGINGWGAESFGPSSSKTVGPHREVKTNPPFAYVANGAELGMLMERYSHFMLDGARRLVGNFVGPSLADDIAWLKSAGKHIALVAHGSEMRDPDRHMARLEESYFRIADARWVDTFRALTAQNAAIFDAFDGPVFVSTPDLILDLPRARWLPVVVDYPFWSAIAPTHFDHKLRVLHRPSRSEPPIKGSDVIVPVLEKLAAEGVIDLVDAPEVPVEEMPALIASSDVVVDQIRTGSYGVAAVEAMAAGRVVVGGVAADVRALVDDDIPIVDGPPPVFEAVMRNLAQQSPEELTRRAEASRAFARRWHDGRVARELLLDFIGSTLGAPQADLVDADASMV
jgi:glycosyltransferase involved in cell wall biosynthesis